MFSVQIGQLLKMLKEKLGFVATTAAIVTKTTQVEAAAFEPKYEVSLPRENYLAPIIPIGVELIKHFEGLRLTAYQDIVGKWTIGYGATGPDIKKGLVWTEEQAHEQLLSRIQEHACYVPRYVSAPLTDNQMAALTSFCYNLGPSNLKDLVTSSKLNEGKYDRCAKNILLYNKARVKQADGTVVKQPVAGLTRRRQAESKLFLTPDEDTLMLANLF